MFELSINGEVAWLTLSRPERRNAISVEGWSRLAATLGKVPPGKVLIVSGEAGGAFCSGADISDFPNLAGDPDAVARFRTGMRRALESLRCLANPTIALVDGACYGAGVALAMACDIRVAGPAARFAITPAKLGISYPQEDVSRLVSLVGTGQASRLLFSGEPLDGQEALRIGLADLFSGEARRRAEELAGTIASNDPLSLAALKSSILLAEEGCTCSESQDGAFDALFMSEGFAARLKGHRSSKQ